MRRTVVGFTLLSLALFELINERRTLLDFSISLFASPNGPNVTADDTTDVYKLTELLREKDRRIKNYKKRLIEVHTQHGVTKKELKEQKVAKQQLTKTLQQWKQNATLLHELTEELRNSYTNIYYHIPKTGGTSLMRMLKKLRTEVSIDTLHPGVCDHGMEPIRRAKNWTRCWLHATEGVKGVTTRFSRRFLVVRDPFHHVVSMYYHCKESRVHKARARFMPPTLDKWLEAWVRVMPEKVESKRFRCYNPINLQSTRTGFLKRSPAKDLALLYDTVGITTELGKSACLISISIHGKVPQVCNCTVAHNASDLVKRFDHGVTHHGDDYNLTAYQRSLIMNLTSNDVKLYAAAKVAFLKKVQQVQNKYSFKLC